MKRFASKLRGLATSLMLATFFCAVPGSAFAQQCDWYGQAYPLCTEMASGWGYENQTSCIGTATCETLPEPYGITGTPSNSGALSITSGSPGSQIAQSSELCGEDISVRADLPAGWRFGFLEKNVDGLLFSVFSDPEAGRSSLPTGVNIECVINSEEGGRIAQLVFPIPPRMVGYGGKCGGFEDNGAQQLCIVGSQCLAEDEDSQAFCVPHGLGFPLGNG